MPIPSFVSAINVELQLEMDTTNPSDFSLILREKSIEPGLKEVYIHNLHASTLAYTYDNENIFNLYFSRTKPNINKGCDCVLLTLDRSDNLNIVLIELKSLNPKASDYESQLINSFIFTKYTLELLDTFESITTEPKFTFALFHLAKARIIKSSVRTTGKPVIKNELFSHPMFSHKTIKKIAFNNRFNNHISINDII